MMMLKIMLMRGNVGDAGFPSKCQAHPVFEWSLSPEMVEVSPEPSSSSYLEVVSQRSPKGAPFCIHAGTRSRDCDPTHCCWKRGRGCLMTHFSSSSSVGAVILWVLLALLLLGAGLFGGKMVLKIGTPKIKVAGEVDASDDE